MLDPGSGWAVIAYDANTLQPGAIQTKYYVTAQFSCHIRPGMTILDTGVSDAAAALDKPSTRLVIVAANTSSSARTLTFDLSRFTTATGGTGGLVPRWNTLTTGGSDLYTPHSDTHLSGRTPAVPFAAKSVQTLQVDGATV